MKNILRTVIPVICLLAAVNVKAQVPVLNSYPSASATVLLDFDGHTVSNTSWNWNGPIVCGGSGLNATQITEVFNRIAEDYRPFNINVTTEEAKYNAAPANRRMRVIMTVNHEWYGTAGGVAFVESFTWGDDTPCFVFTALHNYNVKNIAEAGAHEAGHTLGLYHQSLYNSDCIKLNEYHAGTGSGEIGWAPIMGNGYYRNMTLWNSGSSSQGCNQIQNDLTVITTGNGFSFRTDDHSASANQATTASFTNNQFTVSGVVERNTDQDLFKFTTTSFGRFELGAVPYNVGTGNAGSDLDLQVTLLASNQSVLGVYNPGTLLNSVIDTLMAAGTYYLRIEGRGNMYAPNYASLGSYSLEGAFTVGSALPLRRLELSGQLVSGEHRLNWLIDADEQVVEQVIEMSADGINFRPVVTPNNDARSFAYRPNITGPVQYRILVSFDNGKQHYSNVITLRLNGANPRPRLVSNIAQGNEIMVSSPAAFDYFIYDLNGKAISKGKLATGTNHLVLPAMVNGMYFIRYVNGNENWMEKFVRQ